MTTTLVDSFMEVPTACPCCGKKLATERFDADPECGLPVGYDAWDCADCEMYWECPLRNRSNNDD
jgi:hypothetical protein